MARIEECEDGMLVEAEWLEDDLILPLEQLEGLGVEGRTREAIEDWRYWVARGYAFWKRFILPPPPRNPPRGAAPGPGAPPRRRG